MENTLLIEATEDTPKIEFDIQKNIFDISGRSLPENAVVFFYPAIAWLKEYLRNPNPQTEISLKLEYYNSASARQLADLLFLLEEVSTDKTTIQIKWYYKKQDELMYDKGMEMKEMTELPFDIIEY